jgi:hypothetical protein
VTSIHQVLSSSEERRKESDYNAVRTAIARTLGRIDQFANPSQSISGQQN